MILNPEQEAAIATREGAWVCLATAGAGKTHVLVERIKALLCEGAIPQQILGLTFTTGAASEMNQRIGWKISKLEKYGLRTFHSLGLRLIQEERRHLPFGLSDNPIPEGPVLSKLLSASMKEHGVAKNQFREVRAFISKNKRNRVSPEGALDEVDFLGDDTFALIYQKYQGRLRDGGMLDFDDMVVLAVELLENAEVRARWQYRWLLCDEVQDTDDLQFRMLQLLSEKHGSVFLVGDTNQCHPPGTKIAVSATCKRQAKVFPLKEVPIEELKNGDQVVSWARRYTRLFVTPNKIQVSARAYQGQLIKIWANNQTLHMTPDHQVWVRMVNGEQRPLVYLMWKAGIGFRIGKTVVHRDMGGSRFNQRAREEDADKAWILRICDSVMDALFYEESVGLQYKILECEFPNCYKTKARQEHVKRLFSSVSEQNGMQCLQDHGLLFEHPLYGIGNSRLRSAKTKGYFKTAAANILPGLMRIPLPGEQSSALISTTARENYSGPVYSLNVEKEHTYSANGLIVANCLYGFRGANPDNITSVQKWFPGAKTLILPQNYRSTKSIVDFSRENAPIKNELTENIRTENEQGEKVEFRMFNSDEAEAESTLAAATRDPGNSAILARTNGQLGDFESLCTENFIKFHRLGKSGFWTQSEIKTVVNLAGFTLSPAPAKTFSQEQVAAARAQIRSLSGQRAIEKILSITGIEQMYANQDFADEDNYALKNLKKLQQIAGRFNTLADFVKHARKAEHASRKSKNAVTLSTVHQAKGLEFKNVFVVGASEGILPHQKGEIGEEKRIFFVAISRAAKRLRISFVGTPSQFLSKYLTPEIKKELEKTAEQVEKIERQLSIFA